MLAVAITHGVCVFVLLSQPDNQPAKCSVGVLVLELGTWKFEGGGDGMVDEIDRWLVLGLVRMDPWGC
ncbi:hypothetical protein M758_7G048600 [Ceratodon purpureus]|nr:hypothetical protein M758_7G048600 [Ceratodon purpureus]